MCEHLSPVEHFLIKKGIQETFRGQAWSENCREWVYFDCVLDTSSLIRRFELPGCVTVHENTDPKSGTESGLVCTTCHDGIMGLHPESEVGAGKIVVG